MQAICYQDTNIFGTRFKSFQDRIQSAGGTLDTPGMRLSFSTFQSAIKNVKYLPNMKISFCGKLLIDDNAEFRVFEVMIFILIELFHRNIFWVILMFVVKHTIIFYTDVNQVTSRLHHFRYESLKPQKNNPIDLY